MKKCKQRKSYSFICNADLDCVDVNKQYFDFFP